MEGCIEDLIPYFSEGWPVGPPRGILFHYSGTCEENIKETYLKRHASPHFTISRSGETTQYVSIMNRAWHANDANNYYFGIEHLANPNICDMTHEQLQESARICAELVKSAKEIWGFSIPVIRAPGGAFSPGLKEHKDGLGAPWNTLNHTDGLVQTLTWPQYLQEINNNLEEDEMAGLFNDINDFRREIRRALAGSDDNGDPNLSVSEIEGAFSLMNGINVRLSEKNRPESNPASQRGWDFADFLLELKSGSMASGGEMDGKISGTIKFQ